MRVRCFVILGGEQGTVIPTVKQHMYHMQVSSVGPRVIARVKDFKINSTLFVPHFLSVVMGWINQEFAFFVVASLMVPVPRFMMNLRSGISFSKLYFVATSLSSSESRLPRNPTLPKRKLQSGFSLC